MMRVHVHLPSSERVENLLRTIRESDVAHGYPERACRCIEGINVVTFRDLIFDLHRRLPDKPLMPAVLEVISAREIGFGLQSRYQYYLARAWFLLVADTAPRPRMKPESQCRRQHPRKMGQVPDTKAA